MTTIRLIVLVMIGLFAALFVAGQAHATMTGDGMECSKQNLTAEDEPNDCNTSGQT